MLARGTAVRDAERPRDPRRRLARPTSPTAARPSSACSTTRCTTRSPACPTARCSSTASSSRSAAPSAGSPRVLRRRAVPRPRPLQARQRLARPPRRRPAADGGRARLEAALRPGDTVARLGGDEFTLLLDDVGDAREATVDRRARASRRCRRRSQLDGRELFVVALDRHRARRRPTPRRRSVMRDADVAMYRAKAEGKAPPRGVRRARCTSSVMRRLDLETDLRRAIERGAAARSLYQPIVQAATGRIAGFEALVPLADRRRADRAGEFVADRRGDRADRPARPPACSSAACAQLASWRELPGGDGLTRRRQRLARASSPSRASVELVDGARARRGARPARRCGSRSPRATLARRPARPRGACSARCSTSARRAQRTSTTSAPGASSLRLLHRFPGDAVKISTARSSSAMRPRRGRVRDRQGDRRARAQPRAGGDRGGRRDRASSSSTCSVLGCEFAQGFHIAAPLDADAARGAAGAQRRARAAG